MQNAQEILDELFGEELKGLGRGGKKQRQLQVALGRSLSREDLASLAAPQGARPKLLRQLRTSHHFCAKLVAEGRPGAEIQTITGYASSTISNLKRDPAFQELVEHYRKQTEEIYIDVHQRLSSISLDALEVLQERLASDPDSVKSEEALKIAQLGLDRTGFGPTSTTRLSGGVAVLTEDTLARIKDEANARRRGAVREVQTGLGTPLSLPGPEGASQESEALARGEGEGADLREEIHSDDPSEVSELERSAA